MRCTRTTIVQRCRPEVIIEVGFTPAKQTTAQARYLSSTSLLLVAIGNGNLSISPFYFDDIRMTPTLRMIEPLRFLVVIYIFYLISPRYRTEVPAA